MRSRISARAVSGLALIELLIALFLAALLLTGLVHMVSSANSATRLQDNQAQLQGQVRYAFRLLSSTISQAGYRPRPWDPEYSIDAIVDRTQDNVSMAGDRLVLRTWSELNCFDNQNPVSDAQGNPAFYIRETAFDVNSSGHLARECRYGPSTAELTTQVRRQGLVPGVESFQLLFGLDHNRDGYVEQWVRAGAWSDQARVLGVRIGLALRSDDAVVDAASGEFSLLDTRLSNPPDGRLRTVLEITAAIRGRSG